MFGSSGGTDRTSGTAVLLLLAAEPSELGMELILTKINILRRRALVKIRGGLSGSFGASKYTLVLPVEGRVNLLFSHIQPDGRLSGGAHNGALRIDKRTRFPSLQL